MNQPAVSDSAAAERGTAVPPAAASADASAVELGPISLQDSEQMFRWFNDAEAARTDHAWRPVDGMTHQKWLLALGTDPAQVWFSIRRRGQRPGSLIGFAVLRHISPVHRSAELGIRIGNETDRGQGFGKEAGRQLLDYCWRSLNLNRVQVAVLGDNERSLRLYKSLGFRREGVLRRALFIDGAWRDNVIMALLRPARLS